MTRSEDIDKVIEDSRDRRKAKNKYVIEDQGDIKEYLGINFEYIPDGKIKLSQPHLIARIIGGWTQERRNKIAFSALE